MPKKNSINYPIEVIETEEGIGLSINHLVKPLWKTPRKFNPVTLQEFALEADNYPLCGYEIPHGQRVIVMGSGIYGMDGKLLSSGGYEPEQFNTIFASLLYVVRKRNVVLDAVIRCTAQGSTELVICDCFFGQDWNSVKIVIPIMLRLRVLHDVIGESQYYFCKMFRNVPNIELNFRAVSPMWFFNITDVKTEYTALSHLKNPTCLVLIDSRQVHPHQGYLEGVRTPFKFDGEERCWKLVVSPKIEKEVVSEKSILKPKPKRKYVKKAKVD